MIRNNDLDEHKFRSYRNRINEIDDAEAETLRLRNLKQEQYENKIANAFIKYFGTEVPGLPSTQKFFTSKLKDNIPRLSSLANEFIGEYLPKAEWDKYMIDVYKIYQEESRK